MIPANDHASVAPCLVLDYLSYSVFDVALSWASDLSRTCKHHYNANSEDELSQLQKYYIIYMLYVASVGG